MTTQATATLIRQLSQRATQADRFESVDLPGDEQLICTARGEDVDAHYAVWIDEQGGKIWVALRTPDRWLSESIEASLMHTGDKLEELIEEELVELGFEFAVQFEHFRDDRMLYVFRSPLTIGEGTSADDPELIDRAAALLLAYEATFGNLGDMAGQTDDMI
jgi:hypothetical protein